MGEAPRESRTSVHPQPDAAGRSPDLQARGLQRSAESTAFARPRAGRTASATRAEAPAAEGEEQRPLVPQSVGAAGTEVRVSGRMCRGGGAGPALGPSWAPA